LPVPTFAVSTHGAVALLMDLFALAHREQIPHVFGLPA